MLFCPNCGAKIVQGDKFCRECGDSLTVIRTQNITAGPDEPAPKAPFINNYTDTTSVNRFMGMGMLAMPGITESGRRFSYSTHGMMFNSGCDYSVDEIDGKLIASIRMPNLFKTDAKQIEIDDEAFDKITAIIDKYKGDKWDGFSGHAVDVMDGDAFSFYYSDGKGRKISASGYMSWPDGLRDAVSEIFEILDDIYYVHYPDYNKTMTKFINRDVIQKYGESNRSAGYGKVMGTSPYLSNGPGYFLVGENSLPEGLLAYSIFHEYAAEPGDDTELKMRAVTVMIKKVKAENSDYYGRGINFMYWGFNESKEIVLLDEYLPLGDIVQGQEGDMTIFSYRSETGPILGLFHVTNCKYGDMKQKFDFFAYKLTKDKIEIVDEKIARVSFEQGELSDEQIEGLAEVADKINNDYLSDYIRKCEIRRYLDIYANTKTINTIISLKWSSFIGDKFTELTNVTEKGQPLSNYRIELYRVM